MSTDSYSELDSKHVYCNSHHEKIHYIQKMRVQDHINKKHNALTLNKLLIELRLNRPHCHVLSIRGTVRIIERSTTIQHVFPTWTIPQAEATGLPHEGAHICCTFNLHKKQKKNDINTSIAPLIHYLPQFYHVTFLV